MDVVHPDLEYETFLKEGRFMIQRAKGSARYVYYPRVAEPGTGLALEWVEACGRGTVYSTTVVRAKPPAESHNVALIDLDEGPRMMSRVIGIAPDAVKIGMKVKAKIDQSGAKPLVVFELAE